LKKLKAPDIVIETEEMISKITVAEYEIYCRDCKEEDKKIKTEYAKNNPIQRSIVDEINLRESKLEYDYFTKNSSDEPMLTVKSGHSNVYAHEVEITGPAVVKYFTHRPLSCGARVWIKTENDVIITQ
jgi:hypothetical protein